MPTPNYYRIVPSVVTEEFVTGAISFIDSILSELRITQGTKSLEFLFKRAGLLQTVVWAKDIVYSENGWMIDGVVVTTDLVGGVGLAAVVETLVGAALGSVGGPVTAIIGATVGAGASVLYSTYVGEPIAEIIAWAMGQPPVDLQYMINGQHIAGAEFNDLYPEDYLSAALGVAEYVDSLPDVDISYSAVIEVDGVAYTPVVPFDVGPRIVSVLAGGLGLTINEFGNLVGTRDGIPTMNSRMILDSQLGNFSVRADNISIALQIPTIEGGTEMLIVPISQIGIGGWPVDTFGAASVIFGNNAAIREDLSASPGARAYIFGGSGMDDIFGTEGNDLLAGDSAKVSDTGDGIDFIKGAGGNDYILSGGGRDEAWGDAGTDRIYGGLGDDTLFGGSEDDYLFGDTDVEGLGAGNDVLYGDGGIDRLTGGAGADTLDGGEDKDYLFGGTGVDIYKVGDEDEVSDSDGLGKLLYDEKQLTGGTEVGEPSPDVDCGRPDHKDGDDKIYQDADGNKYERDGDNLKITMADGAIVTIMGWTEAKNLGIKLQDRNASGGGATPCDPAETTASPLVLDLDRDGIEITALASSGVYFDVDRDGTRERTAWVSGDDALLAMDRDNNGRIESATELFGYGHTGPSSLTPNPTSYGGIGSYWESGFGQLALLDTNHDGQISTLDTDFSKLIVWRDLNQDGLSTADEMMGLAAANIASINLNSTAASYAINGNPVTDRSTFSFTDGKVGQVVDAWFQFKQQDTAREGDVDADVLLLPYIRGVGRVQDLHRAASDDPALKAMLVDLADMAVSKVATLTPTISKILMQWHNISGIAPTSRGPWFDARNAALYESITDTPFSHEGDADPRIRSALFLEEEIQFYIRDVAAKLFVQTAAGQSLFPELSFEQGMFLVLDDGTSSATVLNRILANSPSNFFDKLGYWNAALGVVDRVYQSFSDVSGQADPHTYFEALVNTYLDSDGIENAWYENIVWGHIGTSSADTIVGPGGDGNISVGVYYEENIIVTGQGNDTVLGGEALQHVFWGAGQGNDRIDFDPFNHGGFTHSLDGRISLPELSETDVTFSRSASSPLDLVITNTATGETLTIVDGLSLKHSGIRVIFDQAFYLGTGLHELPAVLDLLQTKIQTGGGATVYASENLLDVTTLTAPASLGTNKTYSIIGGADAALFTINATTGVLKFVSARNFESPTDAGGNNIYDVTVQVTDGSQTVSRALAVNLVNQGEAPKIAGSVAGAKLVNVVSGQTAVTTVNASDSDAGSSLTYSVSGEDAALFQISSAGVLTFKAAADVQNAKDVRKLNEYSVTVKVTDGFHSVYQAYAIMVKSASSAPVITTNGSAGLVALSVAENSIDVATVTASVNSRDFIWYQISGGADAAKFEVDYYTGKLRFLAGPDFEAATDAGANNVYEVTVEATDGIASDTQTFSVSVLDLVEAATYTTLSGTAAAENLTGTAGADAIEAGAGNDTISGAAGSDRILGGDGNDTMSGGTGEDYLEGGAGSDIYIFNAGDGADVIREAGSGTDILRINGHTLASANFEYQENGSDLVITFDGSSDRITIRNALNGYGSDRLETIEFGPSQSLSFEAYRDLALQSKVTAGNDIITGFGGGETLGGGLGNDTLRGGGGDDQYVYSRGDGHDVIFDWTADLKDCLVLHSIGTAAVSVSSSSSGDDIVLTVAPSVVGGSDGGTILLKGNARDQAGLGIDEVVFDNGTVWTASHLRALSTGNAPVISSNGGGISAALNVSENALAVTMVTASDADPGASLTYSIVGGADAAKFAINATTGVLSFVTAPDFEAPTDVGANNIYDVIVQVSDGALVDTQSLVVSVTNVAETPVITSNGGGASAAISLAENGSAVTTVAATGSAGKTFSISGGADAAKFSINAATGVLTFVAAPNFEAATDAGANNIYDLVVTVNDGGLTDSQTIAVTVTNANDAPVISSNGGGASAGITVNENTTATTTVTSTDQDSGATKTYSIAGGADAARFAINATTGVLTFVSAPDREAPTDAGADSVYDVVVQVSDGTLIDSQAIAVTVANVNEAPIITSNGGGSTAAISIAENGTTVTTVIATDVDAGSTKTYSISGGADAAKFAINASTGVLTFVAAANFESPTDSGANNVYDVIVQVSDGTLIDTQSIAVTVTNANEAPVIGSNGGGATASISIAENGTAVTTVTSTDQDSGASKTFSIAGGADAAKFAINASTGVLTFVAAPDFESPTDVGANNIYDVIVQVSDGTLTDTQAVAVTVTNVAETPVITSNGGGSTAAISVAENGTAVTTIAATGSAGKTFSISGGADAAKFAINASTGVLTFAAAPNFESPTDSGTNNIYDLVVTVTDGGLTDTQSIAVTVTNANEAPVISSNGGGATASVTVNENSTAVTTVTSTDPDSGATKTFSIVGGADAAKFAVNASTGVLTFIAAPDFEAPGDAGANNIYDVTVQVSDGTLADTQAIAVTVANVASEAPVITSNGGGASAAVALNENGTAVTTVTANGSAGKTFSISGGADAAKFAINATTGVLSFVAAPNFESPTDSGANNVYDLVVTVTDGGLTDTQTIVVTVTNANDAPVISSNGGGATAAVSVNENTTAVTTVTSTDQDSGASKSYSITGGADATKFAINSSTGVLTFVAAPNREAPTDAGADNVYDVIVQVSDGSLIDTQAIAVTVANVNEAPAITSNAGGASAAVSVAENGTGVTTVAAADVDVGTTLTYSISGGADAAKFAINASTGVLTFVTAPNFEAATDSGANNVYDVIVQVSDGALTDTQSIAVTVTNANDAPVISSNGGGASAAVTINENLTAVTTVISTDQDSGASKTFSISGGADAAKFAINSSTGVLTFVAAPDFETPTDAGGNNIYDVVVQVSDGTMTDTQAIAVTIANLSEPPVITSNGGGATASINISENGTAVTTVTANANAGATKTYSLNGGADASKFAINATTGVLSLIAAPNFEAPTDAGGNNVYDVVVRVSDGTNTDDQAIAVTVTNVNEAPIISSNGGGATAAITVNENATAVTTVTSTDVDASATKTFSISGGADAAKFAINSSTGVLAFVAAPDFEVPTDAGGNNVYDVVVQVSDGSLTDTQAIAVTVANVAEGPINGTGGPDTLTGTSGADTLNGLAGSDTLNAGDGDDVLIGGAGADVLNGGNGTDIASYETATAGIYLHTGNLGASTGDALGDTFSSIEQLRGSSLADEIINTMTGATVWGGGGADTITMAASGGTIYGENGADILYGSASFDDVLNGGADNDELYGDGGADTLEGGAGNDWLVGGAGNDAFVFRAGFGDDGIGDFQLHNGGANGDVIEIREHSGLTFAALIADAEQWGPNAHLDLGNGNFITLYDVAVTSLTTQDFRFV